MKQWNGFKGEKWRTSVNTRDFIQANYTEYTGDDSFLEPIAPSTDKLWTKLQELFDVQHEKNGVYDMDNNIPATITSHKPGYLIKEEETIVGLQTDVPLKQAFMPFGGINMANNALTANGFEVDDEMTSIFTDWRKHITKVFLMLILLKCVQLVKIKSLQVYQMLMVVAVSLVIIVVLLYMVLIS